MYKTLLHPGTDYEDLLKKSFNNNKDELNDYIKSPDYQRVAENYLNKETGDVKEISFIDYMYHIHMYGDGGGAVLPIYIGMIGTIVGKAIALELLAANAQNPSTGDQVNHEAA